MHSLLSKRLADLYTSATIAFRPKLRIRFLKVPCSASKVFPCHTKILISFDISVVYFVPGAMIAVPSAPPLGMSPAGLLENRLSSSSLDIERSCGAEYAISVPPWYFDKLMEPAQIKLGNLPFGILPISQQIAGLSMEKMGSRWNVRLCGVHNWSGTWSPSLRMVSEWTMWNLAL